LWHKGVADNLNFLDQGSRFLKLHVIVSMPKHRDGTLTLDMGFSNLKISQ